MVVSPAVQGDPQVAVRPETSPIVDAICGDLTVTFDIHHIDGPAGNRVAEAQVKAIYTRWSGSPTGTRLQAAFARLTPCSHRQHAIRSAAGGRRFEPWDGRPGPLERFKPYLRELWTQGCTMATLLLAEIREQGYTGSYPALTRYLRLFRTIGAAPSATPALPKVRDVTRWSCTTLTTSTIMATIG